jgi:hypothetical protein
MFKDTSLLYEDGLEYVRRRKKAILEEQNITLFFVSSLLLKPLILVHG